MIPAFSPGPCTTLPGPVVLSPRVGSRFKCTREDLYEQCSDHMTEKIPTSVRDGVRPSAASMRVYSSGVMLCCLSSAGVMVAGEGKTLACSTCKFGMARYLRLSHAQRPIATTVPLPLHSVPFERSPVPLRRIRCGCV